MGSISLSQVATIVFLILMAGLVFYYRQPIQKFITETMTELKKVSWTTRKDLLDSTWVVLVSSAVLGLYIAVVDFVLSRVMAFLVKG